MPNGKKKKLTLTSQFFMPITKTFKLSLGPMKAKKGQFLDCQRKNTTGNGFLACLGHLGSPGTPVEKSHACV